MMKAVPVNVFNGFLGAGKTTTILALLRRLPQGYRCALLKNEFGDARVDSMLAQESNVAVTEMTNGCVCCVLVGVMGRALQEIREKYNPDRIIVETSGSAFPAPIVFQLHELEPEGFVLDSVVAVIDCVNFRGYEDTSYTAKMQAQYTDLILLNKHELISERELDVVIDHVAELNPDTPRILCEGEGGVHPDLIFCQDDVLQERLQSQGKASSSRALMLLQQQEKKEKQNHHDQDEHHEHEHEHEHEQDNHYQNEVDLIQIEMAPSFVGYKQADLDKFLKGLPKENVYRIKGLVKIDNEWTIINFAFGRYSTTVVHNSEVRAKAEAEGSRLVVMGVELGMKWLQKEILAGFAATDGNESTKIEISLRKKR